MANPEHVEIIKQGVEVWNKWREDNPDVIPDLEEAELQGAELQGAKLIGANLNNAKLEGAELDNADLRWAKLRKAKLMGAKLIGTNLERTILQSANLTEAIFEGPILLWTNLTGAILKKATLDDVTFENTILNYAQLMETSLIGAKFINARLKGVQWDTKMKCKWVQIQDCWGSELFVRHVKDSAYIEEFQDINPITYKLWKITSDCGRSWYRWAFWSIGLALLFGFIFLPSLWWDRFPHWLHWLQSMSPHLKFTEGMDVFWYTPFYFSVVTFTTLGFGDITPLNGAGQFWLTLEVIIGYIMLGGLISIFATKMVRQS